MNGVNDSLLIAILLSLIFGAVAFYLYSRLGQTEKRLSLMENLLLQLKMATEASLEGPDSIHPISEGVPLGEDDVDSIDGEDYSEMLKEIPIPSVEQVEEQKEKPISPMSDDEETKESPVVSRLDVNYEAMSLNELKAMARQKGIGGFQQKKKRELIELLKKSGSSSATHIQTEILPLEADEDALEGATLGENGFPVEMSTT